MTQLLYTQPQVNTQKEGNWYVWFRFYHAGKWKLIIRKEDINRIKDKKERQINIEGLCIARRMWLEGGWNPVIDPKFKMRRLKKAEVLKEMLFAEALKYALSLKDLASKSKQDYQNMVNMFNRVGEAHGFAFIPIQHVDRGTCLDLIDKVAETRTKEIGKFSNHAYNKYAGCLRSLLTELVDRRVIDNNPLWRFRARDVNEGNKYESFTSDEKLLIMRYLSKHHYNLYRVLQVIYHTGIRPKEVLALRIEDIDLNTGFITIVPDSARENSKTHTLRRVPINGHLHEILLEMQLEKFPTHNYVFGSPFKSGIGNRGAGSRKTVINQNIDEKLEQKKSVGTFGAMRNDFLIPSENHVKRDSITKLWQHLIIDELGIKKHLYAAKHTGIDDKVDVGVTLSELQIMCGHTSEKMTARYNKRKRLTEAKKSILDKSPGFIDSSPKKKNPLKKVS